MVKRNPLAFFIILLILAAITLTGLTWMNYRFAVQSPGGNDFLARWAGAHYWLVEGISPYDDQVSLATQEMIYGHPADLSKGEDKNHFVYPLYSILFFGPFGLMNYTLARAIWMTLLEVSLVVITFLGLQIVGWKLNNLWMAGILIFSMLWYIGIRTLILGQFAGIESLLIVAAIYLILRRHDTEAGILLALSTCKPQMSFLIIPFIFFWGLAARRRKLVVSMVVSFLVLVGVSLLLMPTWPLQWVRQLLDYPSYTNRIGSTLSIIAQTMPGIENQLNIFLHGIFVVYLVFEWWVAFKKDERWFVWTAMMTLVVTNLVAFRTATPHYLAMIPALFLIFKVWEQRWGIIGVWGVGITLALLFFGQWALFLATIKGNLEAPAMYLPLPFLCLIGLWWTRKWAVAPPRLLYDELKDLS